MGVAVVFDEEEEEAGDTDVDEVRDSEDEEDVMGEGQGTARQESGTRRLKGQEDGGAEEEEEQGKLDPHEIDAHWLQRGLSRYYDDADASAKLSEEVLEVLGLPDERATENKLVTLLGFDKFSFVKTLLRNRAAVFYLTRLNQAQSEEDKQAVRDEMRRDVVGGGAAVLDAILKTDSASSWNQDRMAEFGKRTKREARALAQGAEEGEGGLMVVDEGDEAAAPHVAMPTPAATKAGEEGCETKPTGAVDIDALVFLEGGHFMSNKRCELPAKSWRAQKKGYEEVHVPALRHVAPEGELLVPIADLPAWTQPAFTGMDKLNRIQSRMKDAALNGGDNLLLCAPTGAGKTNVAMLAMLHEIGQHRLDVQDRMDTEEGQVTVNVPVDLDTFKMVYIAPMKALVQEVVMNLTRRLKPYGMTVRELSGDQSLTRAQIAETQVIVTTPEKWDIVTRKGGDRAYTQLVRLIIIDEIHLLHDTRGPVLESIVARTIRQVEATQEMVRLVGLSATLPNFEDVATFLRVDPERGLFYFDNSYRPVPLQQQYIGITEKKAMKRFQLMNEICYDKVLAQAGRNQVLIFVHSRAETVKTAKALRDMFAENDKLGTLVKPGSASAEVLRMEAQNAKGDDLKDILPFGFAVHHAGMPRADRNLVEDLFENKHCQVLVSTATLAWGVNLPAHTVILKGTQMYSPEKGAWVELSPLDVLQMMGRAGRPQYDSEGEGIILTQHSELQYYLSLNNQQLPIESQYLTRLADNLNAEVALGTVTTIAEAADWLGYTYLYVRMLRNPNQYGVPEDWETQDPALVQHRTNLAHTAASILDKTGLLRYDRRTGGLASTALGRVASYYYLSHQSMATYNEYLKPTMSDIELFRLFSLSGEFKHIHVREEERLEVQKLAARVPVPIKEAVTEPSAKVNALLQAYISGLKLEGFALVSDMVYVQQSAARILRALFEIALKRGWAALADRALTLCLMVERRCWLSQSPLRHFKGVPDALARKLERKDISWDRYYDLSAADLGELIKNPKMGKQLHRLVHQFPRLELSAAVQPITRSLLRVDLRIQPDFRYDVKVHDTSLLFHVLVEDVDGNTILHHEPFVLTAARADQEHSLVLSVPLSEPLPPQVFIRVVADRWLHCTAVLPVSFRHLILPTKFAPPTELLDLQPLPFSALRSAPLERLYAATSGGMRHFNPIQTQTFSSLYESGESTLVCAPAGSGKSVCAEFAILRLFRTDASASAVYVAPKAETVDASQENWRTRLEPLGIKVERLTGEAAADLKLLAPGRLVMATAEHWDMLSRRWRQRKAVQQVSLLVVDDIHLLGGKEGPVLEVVVSRARYVASQTERPCRIVALGSPLANAKDVGEWMGAPSHSLFNFHPSARPSPLELRLQGFDVGHFGSRLLAMAKPTYQAVSLPLAGYSGADLPPCIVFVPSRKQSQLTAIDLMTYAAAEGLQDRFVGTVTDGDEQPLVKAATLTADASLKQTLAHGVAFVHGGLNDADRTRTLAMFSAGHARALVVPYTMCWALGQAALVAKIVVVMGTECYDGREKRYADYPATDLLQMVGMAGQAVDTDGSSGGRCHVLCHAPKKDYLRRLLQEPLPIESHIDHALAEHLNAEVVTRTVESKQDAVDYLTWTFYYRRLTKNPNYYNMAGVSHHHLSDHLSELVESVVTELEEARCLAVDEESGLAPLNLGMIAAYYYIQCTTVELFASSVTAKTKLRGLVDILASSSEYNALPLRHREGKILETLAKRLPQALPSGWEWDQAPAKAHVLLQSHCKRTNLPVDLRQDAKMVVLDAPRLLSAVVDVISSMGWLKPALEAMELTQMIVQACWGRDSYLRQVPHLDDDTISALAEAGVETPLDILSMEDEDREKIIQVTSRQMADIARFCNAYPNIEVNYEIEDEDEISAGEAVTMVATLQREEDEDDETKDATTDKSRVVVNAPLFPGTKTEGWWLVVGDPATNALLAIKRVNLGSKANVKLDFAAPDTPGKHKFVLNLMCDSYMGCDQEYEFEINVGEAAEEE
eukprot:TRINITY_DN6549_c0_g3_i1.p1 TRINITY_DN6549_c0_g3~~TRINITY_DN6549_c0_g3_i1.p1  ORF type:complete len:2065 (-),score=717.17 TRINITY_DN6549_c0_g3_i1:1631-7681(-)